MKVKTNEIIEEVTQIFTAYLEQKKHRKTPERFSILKEIYKLKGHFDVETLYLKMKNSKYSVSRATLYNTFDLLLDCGLIVKHHFGNNFAQFEKSYRYGQHDHIVCIDTKKVVEFCDPRIQQIKETLEKTLNLDIKHHSLTFYAKCKLTVKKNKKQ